MDFCSLYTKFPFLRNTNPSSYFISMFSLWFPFKNAVLTSIYQISKSRHAAMDKSILMDLSMAIGERFPHSQCLPSEYILSQQEPCLEGLNLPIRSSFPLVDPLTTNGFNIGRCFYKIPYLIGIYRLQLSLHSFNLISWVNISHCFFVCGRITFRFYGDHFKNLS